MSRASKISRQISVLMLAVVFVSALALASGLFVFSRGENEILPADSVPLAENPGSVRMEPPPDPSGESPLTILSACLLVVFTVVLLWFLVFRPVRPKDGENEETAMESQMTRTQV